jgi:hypothetical protein
MKTHRRLAKEWRLGFHTHQTIMAAMEPRLSSYHWHHTEEGGRGLLNGDDHGRQSRVLSHHGDQSWNAILNL